jgi:hypothetical protein
MVASFGVWTSNGTQPVAAGGDPLAVMENLVVAANETFPNGDPEPFANVFTEDGWFANTDDAFAVVGRAAMLYAFSEPDEVFQATLIEAEVDGNTVTGSASIVDQDTVDAGVPAHIELFTTVVEGDLVASFTLTYDHSDPDTVTYLEYLDSLPDDGEGPPPGSIELDMEGDQAGSVAIFGEEGVTFVAFGIDPGAEGVLQPAHVHTGTCDDPGPVVYPLASLRDGGSFTLLSTTPDELLTNDYIVNVHLSEAEIGTYVSCAALEAPEEEEEPTATPGISLPPTGSGGAGTDGSWLLVALVAAAAAGLAGLGGVRMARR